MKTTAYALEFSFTAESFNLAGEILPAAEPTTAGQLPDLTTPAAELLPEPSAKPAAAAPWFIDFGTHSATVRHEGGPFPWHHTLTDTTTGRAVAGGWHATAADAKEAAATMAAALSL
jgi:hypothetical protein